MLNIMYVYNIIIIISSNITDNVIAESESGKKKIGEYISRRVDRN